MGCGTGRAGQKAAAADAIARISTTVPKTYLRIDRLSVVKGKRAAVYIAFNREV
jgi:hypothetical protein